AFQGCSGLTSISIPEGVTTIGAGAFQGCSSLDISVNEDNTTYSSEDEMLLNKEKTILIAYPSAKETVTNVPTSVKTIDEYAFDSCSGLTSISIPSSVTSIGNYAFYGCSSLTSISIPSSVTSIGNHAFQGCSGATVKVEAENPPTWDSGVFKDVSKILVPKDSVNKYREAENWKEYSGKIEAVPDQTS
ncbi:MAG: leucine-rich repeat domain-containing protein, partial [Spirochaetaceae bacterium]|nr:leucine-rich repeat domain-containing protein [Spirochaetaceae bacterium]